MRLMFAGLSLVALVAACGGGGGPATTRPSTGAASTPAGPGATTGSLSTPAPANPPAGGESVSVTLTGGEDAGSYTGAGDPNCSQGIVGEGVWGVQFSLAEGAADQLSSVQMVYRPEGTADDDEGMFSGVQMLLTVGFADLLDPAYRDYEVEIRTDGEESSGTGEVTVTESGSTALIHATGTTAEGVQIDATVNCPSVFRM